MRWKRLCGSLALALAFTSGCKQRIYMTEADFNRTTTTLLDHMELKQDLGQQPITEPHGPPPTLNDLDRKIRYISLAECIAISLEMGRVGQFNILFPGTANDNLVQFTGRGITGSDAIRVFALEPARVGAEMEAALTKFDAVFTSGINWQTTNTPIGTPLQTLQAGASPLLGGVDSQEATANVGLLKPLATGGVAGITFNVPYTFTNLRTNLNPSYRPQMQFQFEQPLLQGFGVEINQLRAGHPGSLLNSGLFNTQPTGEGILITRLRFDQSRAEFERQLNQMLLNVEVAYWNLYGSYWQLYSREQGLRFAFETFKLNKAKYEAGRATAADFYQSRGQYELFRAQRLQALDQVLENERQLRALMGLPVEDCTRLMPSDSPTLAPFQPDWCSSVAEALEKRPELYMVRQDIKASQMRLILAKNSLLPDLRFTGSYDVNSIGTRLDGSSTPTLLRDDNGAITGQRDVNALRGLADNNFNSWSMGLRMVFPLGFRLGYTQVRQAQLELARDIEILKDQELKVVSYMANYYRRLSLNYEQIRANRAQREAFGEQLRAKQQEFLAGRGTLDILLEAQRFWSEALSQEYQAIVQYNNALAGFEFAKGTIQHHDNVYVAEGALPQCASVRAVDHQQQRTASIVLHERAMPTPIAPNAGPIPTRDGKAPSLPSVMAAQPPLKDAPSLPATIDALRSVPAPVDMSPKDVFPAPAPEASVKPEKLPFLPKPAPGTNNVPGPTAAPPLKKPPIGRRESDFGTARPAE